MNVEMPDGTVIENVPDDYKQSDLLARYSKMTEKPQGKISALEAFNQRAQNALSLGFAPAIDAAGGVAAGAVKGLFGGDNSKTYEDYLKEYKAQDELASKEHPTASTAGDIAGFIGGLATAAPAKGYAAIKNLSLAKQALSGAKTAGGILGAQQAATTDGDLAQKAKAGLTGAALGATLGAAVPAIISGGGAIARGVKGLAKRATATPETLAAEQLKGAITRDNIDVSQIPLEKNVLQTMGGGVLDRAEAIAQRSNKASDRLKSYAAQRTTELPKDLAKNLGNTFQEADYPTLLGSLKEQTYKKAKPAYEEAYKAVTKINDPKINEALDKIAAAGDWDVLTKEARTMAAYDGKKLGNIDITGNIRSFTTQDLDYMTQALRNLGQSTEGRGAMGSKTPIGGLRSKTAGEIRDRLKELNPKFAEATKQFSDDVALYKSAELGKQANIFGNNYKTALSEYKALPNESAKAAWRIGQAEALHNMINTNPSAALRRFNSPQFKKSMEAFYTPDELQSITTNLNNRLREQGSLQRVINNSRTQARQALAAEDAAMQADLGGFASDLVTGGPKTALMRQLGSAIESKITNTPTQQAADKMVVDYLLSTPFQLAGKSATGLLPKSVFQATLPQNVGALNTVSRYNASPFQGGLLARSLPLISGD